MNIHTIDPDPRLAEPSSTRQGCIALIPARAGSVRCPGKNTAMLVGHPLLAYTISAALDSGLFDLGVYVTSQDEDTLALAARYGARPWRRPASVCGVPDILWVRQILDGLMTPRRAVFSILRPTSPFRTAETILRAWEHYLASGCDTLRAMQPVREHPGKMWVPESAWRMRPVLDGEIEAMAGTRTPYHSSPTQSLPPAYVQNASLEFAPVWVAYDLHRITGHTVTGFITRGYEGFDINTVADLWEARGLAIDDPTLLPPVRRPTPA
jgi:CMP-N,N'-diacetyllegionaminic acid synthase